MKAQVTVNDLGEIGLVVGDGTVLVLTPDEATLLAKLLNVAVQRAVGDKG